MEPACFRMVERWRNVQRSSAPRCRPEKKDNRCNSPSAGNPHPTNIPSTMDFVPCGHPGDGALFAYIHRCGQSSISLALGQLCFRASSCEAFSTTFKVRLTRFPRGDRRSPRRFTVNFRPFRPIYSQSDLCACPEICALLILSCYHAVKPPGLKNFPLRLKTQTPHKRWNIQLFFRLFFSAAEKRSRVLARFTR